MSRYYLNNDTGDSFGSGTLEAMTLLMIQKSLEHPEAAKHGIKVDYLYDGCAMSGGNHCGLCTSFAHNDEPLYHAHDGSLYGETEHNEQVCEDFLLFCETLPIAQQEGIMNAYDKYVRLMEEES